MAVELYAARMESYCPLAFFVHPKPFLLTGPRHRVWEPGWQILAIPVFSTRHCSVWHTQRLLSTISAAVAITDSVWLIMTVIYFSFAAVFSASLRQQILSNLFSILRPVVWLCLSYCFCLRCFDMVGHQEEHQACKNWVIRWWHGYLSRARCRLLPVISCLVWILAILVLHLCYWLTQVVLETRQLKRV